MLTKAIVGLMKLTWKKNLTPLKGGCKLKMCSMTSPRDENRKELVENI